MQEKKYKNHQFIACNPEQKSPPTSAPASQVSRPAPERNAHLRLDINNLQEQMQVFEIIIPLK